MFACMSSVKYPPFFHFLEPGFEIHPDYWRKDITTEALQAMVRYSSSHQARMPVHHIEAMVVPWMYICMLC